MILDLDLDIRLPDKNSGQLAKQLYRQLRLAILSGRISSGTRLPPTRKMALALGVGRNTVVMAYDLLLSEGYLSGRVGSGHFVNAIRTNPPDRRVGMPGNGSAHLVSFWHHPPVRATFPVPERVRYDFRFGHPEVRYFPHHTWQRLANRSLRQAIRRGENAGPPEGLAVLREAIVKHVSFSRAVACLPENVVVTNGSQQGFSLLAQVLVRPGKTIVAVENPGYPPAHAAFAAAGATVVPVPVDAEGIVVSAIPQNASLVYVTPTHQSPLGMTMSVDRRMQLLEFARAHSSLIVEDDYDSEFRFGDRPHDALQTLDDAGRVFYVGTFTKSLLPSLRVGFVVCPPWATAALVAAKRAADGQCAAILHATLADFILEGHLARYVRKMRTVYGRRHGVLVRALSEHLAERLTFVPTSAGIHCATFFRSPTKIGAVLERAAGAGIAIEDVGRFWIGPRATDGLVFGFGAMTENEITDGIARLASVLP